MALTKVNYVDNVTVIGASNLNAIQDEVIANGQDIDNLERGKVDKVPGKGLSSNDYTTEEKNKLSGISAEANASDVTYDSANRKLKKTVNGTAYDVMAVDETLTENSTNPVSSGGAYTQLHSLGNTVGGHTARIETLEALEKGRGFTPAQIQQIAASGHADEYFSIGDIIYMTWTDKSVTPNVEYNVPVVVVHFGDAYDENDVLHENAMWLMWMYATPQAVQFDAAEAIVETETTFQNGFYYYTKNEDNSFTEQTVTPGDTIPAGTTYYKHVRTGMAGRLRYGSNDYVESAVRQWLNSDEDAGSWWTAQHDSDVAPSQASTLPGFLTGFGADWLAVFKPVKIQVAKNTSCDGGVTAVMYDKFFLPSLEQMYGSPQASGVEGDYWEYWKEETGLSSPSNGSSSNTNAARQIPSVADPTGAAVYCRLRSAYRSNTHYAWSVYAAGYLASGSAYSSYRAQPACVIY